MAERAAVVVMDTGLWIAPLRGEIDGDALLFMQDDRIRTLAGARFLAVMWAAT